MNDGSIQDALNNPLGPNGSFQAQQTFPTGSIPYSVVASDVNGAGKPDLVVANGDSNTVGVLLGNGNGTFQTAVTYDSGGQLPVSVAVGDLLLTGGRQAVVANGCADKTACSGSGESGVGVLFGFFYPPAATYRSGGSVVQSVKIADVNNDGIPDLLVAHVCAIRHKIPGIEQRFAARFREQSNIRAERKALRDSDHRWHLLLTVAILGQ